VGVSRVLVGEAGISSEGWRGAAHSLQNFVSAGFSELHLGHFIAFFPLAKMAKEYQFIRKESNLA
jgi:hypothetical protein